MYRRRRGHGGRDRGVAIAVTIDPDSRARIENQLPAIAAQHKVEILFAVESGSRAWGFPSLDSDYDVRFVYRHERDWYISLVEQRDVIEPPLEGDLDLSGWDLRKALRLLSRSNPALYEWLVSPIVYADPHGAIAEFRALAEANYSQATLAHHYLSILRGHLRLVAGDPKTIKLKKYFYAVRPVAATLWLRRRGTLPRMNLVELLDGAGVTGPVRDAIDDLIAQKAATEELGDGPCIPVLDRWIEENVQATRAHCDTLVPRPPDQAAIDAFFRTAIGA